MLKEAIILSGGFGTRLREVVSDLPKSMAPVNNKPFLDYILRYLEHYKIENITLALGYMANKVMEHYGDKYNYSVENEPLGTGGAIRLAMQKCKNTNVLVLNGDTFFDIDLKAFYNKHNEVISDFSLALRKVDNAARFGTLQLGVMDIIKEFKEKTGLEQPGIINAGVYILDRAEFLDQTPADVNFSIEKDFFEKKVRETNLYGFVFDDYFIDIGVPEDYKKAQHDFKDFTY